MKKNKLKKISAKLLLVVFIINAICIFGFTTTALAVEDGMNLSISDYDIIEGESVIIIWDHKDKDPDGIDRYSDYDTQIYISLKNKDTEEWSSWTHVASVDWNYQSTQSYSLSFDDGGTYMIRLVQYARRKGHWEKDMYSDYVWVGTTGTWFVAEEISSEIYVEYSMNVQLNIMTIDEGDSITLSWNLVIKDCDDYYNGYRCGYIDYDTEIWIQKDSENLTQITTVDFIGNFIGGKSETQYYTVTIPQAGCYKFILKEYSREKGYWDHWEEQWYGIREDNLLYEGETETFLVDELLYDLNANPDIIHQGEQTTISWMINPKIGASNYLSILSLKYENGNQWYPLIDFSDSGSHSHDIVLNQPGFIYFKVDLYIDGVYTTSENTVASISISFISAENRRFPSGEATRLIYTLQTIKTNDNFIPRIYYGFSKDTTHTVCISYNVYVDGIMIRSVRIQYLDSSLNFETFIEEPNFKITFTHQIEIEITSSIDLITEEKLDNNIFTLKYLKIGGIEVREGKKYAIIIGISDYGYISDLNYGDEDASDWYYHLTELGYSCEVYGDFNQENYPIWNGCANENRVRKAIQDLALIARPGDHIVITTSGHGGNDCSEYLCMWDCGYPDYYDGCYFDTELASDIELFDTGINMFFLLDNCFTGGIGSELMTTSNKEYIYCVTPCTSKGWGFDSEMYQNGLWNYYFLDYSWQNHFCGYPFQSMESVFQYAHENYPLGGECEPQEFDGNRNIDFYL